jgi:hypothetical protein
MKPLPWSFSALDTFKNCPRQYHAKYVLKSVKEAPSEQMLWGTKVHKHFEDRLAVNEPLPVDLKHHEEHMQKLANRPGVLFTEQKIGLDINLKPCNFFFRDPWFRGVIDLRIVDTEDALLVDYKTGKPHQKFTQLSMFAIHTFAEFPAVKRVNAQFYWTKDGTTTKKIWGRADIPTMWKAVVPDLRQYMEAFKTDTWQARQSGLCKGWCPVHDCEFWSPKQERR